MSIRKGNYIIAGSGGSGGSEEDNVTITKNSQEKIQTVGMLNKNTATGATSVQYDWIGTLAEHTAQNIETLHPDWICYITDDVEGGESVYTKDEVNSLINNKQDVLISGTNIKTINSQSILGSGNIEIQGGGDSNVDDVKVNNVSVVTNKVANIDLTGKQDVISDLSTIRSGAEAGSTALQPDDNISELTNDAGYITSSYHDDTKQDVLTAGTNVDITNNVISATDTTYTAGNGLTLTGTTFSANVIDNTNSDSTINALSARVGKALQEQINNLNTRGKYLSIWDCTTGLAMDEPPVNPYTVETGSFFIVGKVGTTNYRPNGGTYNKTIPSTTVETGDVKVNDTYYYDGTTWRLLETPEISSTFATLAGSPYDNINLKNALDAKQDSLASGTNIKTINNTSILGSGNLAISELPSQSGQSGKYLTTNGTTASWATIDVSNYIKKSGNTAVQNISTSNDTPLGLVSSGSTSTYVAFSNSNGWIGSYGVNSSKTPVFYDGALNYFTTSNEALKLRKCTQVEYDALTTKDSSTVYIIIG